MDTNTDLRPIVAAARLEADRMRAAVTGQQGAAPIRMSAAHFEALASLIERLADRCVEQAADCWLDRPDQAMGAVRSWVPLAHLEAAQRRVTQCEAEVLEARSQLEAREADNIRLTSLAFGVHPAC